MRLVAATSQHCISDSWMGIQQSYLWNMQNYCFNPMWKRQWATHSLPNSPPTQQSWHPMSQSHWMPNMNECLVVFHHERLPIKSRSPVQVTEQHSAIAEKQKRLQHHLAWTCPWHKNWSLWCVLIKHLQAITPPPPSCPSCPPPSWLHLQMSSKGKWFQEPNGGSPHHLLLECFCLSGWGVGKTWAKWLCSNHR